MDIETAFSCQGHQLPRNAIDGRNRRCECTDSVRGFENMLCKATFCVIYRQDIPEYKKLFEILVVLVILVQR